MCTVAYRLSDMGHTVVGVEGVEHPIQAFLDEHSVQYSIRHNSLVNGKVFEVHNNI